MIQVIAIDRREIIEPDGSVTPEWTGLFVDKGDGRYASYIRSTNGEILELVGHLNGSCTVRTQLGIQEQMAAVNLRWLATAVQNMKPVPKGLA